MICRMDLFLAGYLNTLSEHAARCLSAMTVLGRLVVIQLQPAQSRAQCTRSGMTQLVKPPAVD